MKASEKYGYNCELNNFISLCKVIAKNIAENNRESAIKEMHRLCHLFRQATVVDYKNEVNIDDVYNWKVTSTKTLIEVKKDFNVAKKQITAFIEEYYKFGEFNIIKEVFKLPYWCVNWDYYNSDGFRFIKACKEANKLFDNNRDEEVTKYYEEEGKAEYGFEIIFYSSYNGGRVRAGFRNKEDALYWDYFGDAHFEESNGLYWAEQPAY